MYQHHIILKTKEQLSPELVADWLKTVKEFGPDDIAFAYQHGDHEVHMEYGTNDESPLPHSYVVPLKRDMTADETFIIKYPHDAQAHLSLHHDHASITTLVNLNPGEFEGGGTYFPRWKTLINPEEIGTMTLHPSNITHKHGARPVTKGIRYVVVSFIKNTDLQ